MGKQKNTKKNSKKKNQNFDSSSFPQFSQCPNNVPKPLQQNYIKQSQIHKSWDNETVISKYYQNPTKALREKHGITLASECG
jgi:hypothetical protein